MGPLTERVARAIYEAAPVLRIHDDEPMTWDEAPTLIRKQAFEQARAAIAIIKLED